VSETTSLGAAYAAGLAVGFWNSLDDLRANWKRDRVWEPQMNESTRERLYRDWLKAVERTLNWVE
jgi:glycerol kinase